MKPGRGWADWKSAGPPLLPPSPPGREVGWITPGCMPGFGSGVVVGSGEGVGIGIGVAASRESCRRRSS